MSEQNGRHFGNNIFKSKFNLCKVISKSCTAHGSDSIIDVLCAKFQNDPTTEMHIDGLVQERLNSIANSLELHLFCTNPSILWTNDTNRQVSNIRCTLVDNKIVDHSDVVGASPVGAAPTISSFST